jgi:hypothetical protein
MDVKNRVRPHRLLSCDVLVAEGVVHDEFAMACNGDTDSGEVLAIDFTLQVLADVVEAVWREANVARISLWERLGDG